MSPDSRKVHGRGRGPHAGAVEPGQGAVPGGRVHQGAGDRLLPADRVGAAAAHRAAAGDHQAVPGRRGRQVLLPEERAAASRLGADRARCASPGSTKSRETIEYLLGGDLPTLIWAANLAALELHTPMWRYPTIGEPDLLVFDLDPGAPATIVECCAGRAAAAAAADRAGAGPCREDVRRQGPAAVRGGDRDDVGADQ